MSSDTLAAREERLRQMNEQLEMKRRETVEAADNVVREQGEKLRTMTLQSSWEMPQQSSALQSPPRSPLRSTSGAPESGMGTLQQDDDFGRLATQWTGLVPGSPTYHEDGTGDWSLPTSPPRSEGPAIAQHQVAAAVTESFPEEAAGEQADAISGMGQEAASRYMKAKLRVLQEELEAALKDGQKKDARIAELSKEVKATSEKQSKLQSVEKTLQGQVEKQKRAANSAQQKATELEQKNIALRKELDALSRTHKQSDNDGAAKEVRLNRALEEIERLKQQLKDARSQTRDASDSSRRSVEQLIAENKKLEKQKNELLLAFKKQLKLIHVLRQQKMHVEAARLLTFTEEEFTNTMKLGA